MRRPRGAEAPAGRFRVLLRLQERSVGGLLPVQRVALSRHGRLWACGGAGDSILLGDEAGVRRRFSVPDALGIQSLAFDSSGTRVLAAPYILDVETGAVDSVWECVPPEIRRFGGPRVGRYELRGGAFAPSGRFVALILGFRPCRCLHCGHGPTRRDYLVLCRLGKAGGTPRVIPAQVMGLVAGRRFLHAEGVGLLDWQGRKVCGGTGERSSPSILRVPSIWEVGRTSYLVGLAGSRIDGGSDGPYTVRFLRLPGCRPKWQIPLRIRRKEPVAMAVSPERRIAVLTHDGWLFVFEAHGGLLAEYRVVAQAEALAVSGRRFLVTGRDEHMDNVLVLLEWDQAAR